MTALEIAKLCRACIDDKKGIDPVILDLRGLASFTDYFVVASAQSEPQIKAIASELLDRVPREAGVRPLGRDGAPASQWIVVDFGEVLVHLFHEQRRAFYRLEELWNDAPRIE